MLLLLLLLLLLLPPPPPPLLLLAADDSWAPLGTRLFINFHKFSVFDDASSLLFEPQGSLLTHWLTPQLLQILLLFAPKKRNKK